MLPGPCQGTVPLIPTPCGVLPEHFCLMCLVMLRHSFPSDHHRLPIPGWSRLCRVRFPNLLPERILPFPEKTVCERGAVPSMPPWVWGLKWGACGWVTLPLLCFVDAAVTCGLSCLVLLLF